MSIPEGTVMVAWTEEIGDPLIIQIRGKFEIAHLLGIEESLQLPAEESGGFVWLPSGKGYYIFRPEMHTDLYFKEFWLPGELLGFEKEADL